jgi:nucleoid-associated protein YgaU
MSRYKYTKIVKDGVTKKRVLGSTDYPIIQSKDTDIIYFVRFDDTYMKLAHRFYGDQSLWWIIARANGKFSGNFTMEVGKKIRIPQEVGEILRQHSKLNRVVG